MNGKTGTETQMTQHVRGCVSPRLFLSCQSRTDAPLQSMFTRAYFSAIRDSVSNLVGSNHGTDFRKAARLTRSPQSHGTNASRAFAQ